MQNFLLDLSMLHLPSPSSYL